MRQAPVALAVLLSAAAASAAPKITADKSSAVLGETEALTLTVISEDAELSTAVSSGTLVATARDGDRHTYRWTLPDLRFPTTAVFAFWSARATSPDLAVLTVPLHGRTTLEMDTEPGADVRVQVAGSTFGPVKANPKGRVKVPIEVPPGVRSAQVIAVAKGQQTSRAVPLEVPKTAPYAVAIGPDPLPASGGWLALVFPDSVDASGFRIDAQGANATEPRTSAGRATWTLVPAGAERTPITLNVSGRGAGAESRSATVTVGQRISPPPAFPSTSLPIVPRVLAGGFFGGGRNAGFAAELGAEATFSPLPSWLALDASVGVRTATFSFNPGEGNTRSSLLAAPVLFGASARLFQRDAFGIDVRAHAGPVPFRHSFSADFGETFVETGVGFAVGGGPGLSWKLGPVELVLEVRGVFSQTRTAHLIARPGGLVALLGAEYTGR